MAQVLCALTLIALYQKTLRVDPLRMILRAIRFSAIARPLWVLASAIKKRECPGHLWHYLALKFNVIFSGSIWFFLLGI